MPMPYPIDPQRLFGVSAVITSVASLLWSCRRAVGSQRAR